MAKQKMDDLFVEMIGDNKKYVRMLRNSLKETKIHVQKINAELSKIKDPGAGLSSYGGGIGGGRRTRGGSRARKGGKRGAGALGIAAGSLGTQGFSMGGGIGGGSAAHVWELANALKSMGAINPATITITLGAIGSYLAYKFSPYTKAATEDVEQLKASLQGIPDTLDKHLDARKFEMNFVDGIDNQVAELQTLLHNAEFGFNSATNSVEKFRREIDQMQTRTSKNAYLDPFLDKHAIETDKVLMEDAAARAGHYGNQVHRLTQELRLAQKAQADYNARLDAMPEDFFNSLNKQLDSAWVTETMKMAGASDQEVQRAIQLRTLEEDMAKVGRQLTDEQRKHINLAMEELSIIEKRAEARKQEQKLSAENARIAKRQREEFERERLRINEDIAQRAFAYLEAEKGPMEKLKEDLLEVRQLVDQGGLTRGEAKKIMGGRLRRMAESFGYSDNSAGAAIRSDSVEGYSLTKFGQHQRTSAEDLRSMLKELVNQGRTLDEIREGVTSHGPPLEPVKQATL